MKRVLALILCLALSFTLTACGANTEPSADPAPATSAPAEAPAEATPADDINWPNGNITLLCGLSAGGSSDLGARLVANGLSKELGVSVTVENVTGGGSWIAWNQLLHNTDLDGNTFAFINHNVVFGQYDDVNPREDGLDDFELLMGQLIDYSCIMVRADDDRFTDFASFVELAQTTDLMTSCTGTGITDGDATLIEVMRQKLGCKITIVPTDGGTEALSMLLAGDIDFYLNNACTAARSLEDGYKVICTFSDERTEALPDVPTAKESGLLDYTSGVVRGFAYPKGVAPEIVKKMTDAMRNVMNSQEYLDSMKQLSLIPVTMEPDELYDALSSQLDARLEIYGLERK